MVEQIPFLTVLPPLVAIIAAIATRRVVLSLGLGVILAALLVENFNPLGALNQIWQAFAGIFFSFEDGAVNTGQVFNLVFLLLLGAITALVLMSGGTEAFSDWAVKHIKSRRGAKLLSAFLGMAIFIDDYFNALAVGQVARPVSDRFKVSRAKLAYIIDSTAAPVSVLAPFSSWGASIIGLIAPIVATAAVAPNGVVGFLAAAVANYYAIGAVVAVFLVIYFSLEAGPMRREERRALKDGEPFARDAEIPGELSEDLPVYRPGAIQSLIVPFILLVVGVIGAMFATGFLESGSTNPMDMLANTLVSDSLLYGGLIGLAAAIFYYFRSTYNSPKFSTSTLFQGLVEGVKSMLPAIYILVLAWMLGTVIEALGTGEFLGGLVTSAGIPTPWLVPLMFVVAAGMAFATGTSWGSFGLLIPLAGEILLAVGATDMVLPALGAVLAGAVMGDHCSPISDTTILSATGAGCEVVTHVSTQLPYALATATAALVGYVSVALTHVIWVGLIVTLVVLVALILFGTWRWTRLEKIHGFELDETPLAREVNA